MKKVEPIREAKCTIPNASLYTWPNGSVTLGYSSRYIKELKQKEREDQERDN